LAKVAISKLSTSKKTAITDGKAPAKVQLQPRIYPKSVERLMRRKPTESMAPAGQLKMNLPSF
jgi:hypothetical protein